MALLLWAMVLAAAPAWGFDVRHDPTVGDEDPFPLMCTDFSGTWRGDGGGRYVISQRRCNWIRMQMFYGADQDTMTIVPDNRTRPGPGKDSKVRHRWNSPRNATVIESHRSFVDEGALVTEVTMMERAPGTDLLLETTYRTIECNGLMRREYEQQVFRRVRMPGFDDLKKRPGKKISMY